MFPVRISYWWWTMLSCQWAGLSQHQSEPRLDLSLPLPRIGISQVLAVPQDLLTSVSCLISWLCWLPAYTHIHEVKVCHDLRFLDFLTLLAHLRKLLPERPRTRSGRLRKFWFRFFQVILRAPVLSSSRLNQEIKWTQEGWQEAIRLSESKKWTRKGGFYGRRSGRRSGRSEKIERIGTIEFTRIRAEDKTRQRSGTEKGYITTLYSRKAFPFSLARLLLWSQSWK